jgi:hypothetical protein
MRRFTERAVGRWHPSHPDYAFCCYLIGPEVLRDAFNPLAPKTYLAVLPLASGSLLVWLKNLRRRVLTRCP